VLLVYFYFATLDSNAADIKGGEDTCEDFEKEGRADGS
jgi:hypothetical protein